MAGYQYRDEPAECPRCGGSSICVRWSDYPEWPRRPQRCPTCVMAVEKLEAEFRVLFERRLPVLRTRVMRTLTLHYADQGGGFEALLRADDDELLSVRDMGPKMLAEFRAVWPVPLPSIPISDDWTEHAAMVALAGGGA